MAIRNTPTKFKGVKSRLSDETASSSDDKEEEDLSWEEDNDELDFQDQNQEEEEEENVFTSPHPQRIARSLENLIELVDEELLFRLNYYSKVHLKKLRGIGEKRAAYILKRREAQAPNLAFSTVYDLVYIGGEEDGETLPLKVVEKLVSENRCKILLEHA